jgi:hypothetical protein
LNAEHNFLSCGKTAKTHAPNIKQSPVPISPKFAAIPLPRSLPVAFIASVL